MIQRVCLIVIVIGGFSFSTSKTASAFYLAEQGRFVSRDSAGYKDGLNLYQYVGGNPSTFADPSGKDRYHCGGSHPGDHSRLFIQDPSGGYFIFEIGFPGENGSSGECFRCPTQGSSGNCGTTNKCNTGGGFLNGVGCFCSYFGPGYSYVPVSETHTDGLPGGCETIPSTPEQDQSLIDEIRGGPDMVGFHPWFKNCHLWTRAQKKKYTE